MSDASPWRNIDGGLRRPRKAYLVVSVAEDYDPVYDDFDTLEEARAFTNGLDRKSCIVGPDFVEDHS